MGRSNRYASTFAAGSIPRPGPGPRPRPRLRRLGRLVGVAVAAALVAAAAVRLGDAPAPIAPVVPSDAARTASVVGHIAAPAPAGAPFAFAAAVGASWVTLRWTPPEGTARIQISRDGRLIDEFP